MNDPMLPEGCTEFYNKWNAIYGPGAPKDAHREIMFPETYGYNMIDCWRVGVEAAGTFEAAAVRDALLAMPSTPHILGETVWWGKEMYGVDHAAAPPQFIAAMQDGVLKIVAVIDFIDWWENNKVNIIDKFTEAGLMYWQ